MEEVDKSAAQGPVAEAAGGQVGIFVKAPVPGRVKTRLCPPLTAQEAADFYRTALEETVTRLVAGPWEVTLFFDGPEQWLAARFPELPRSPQGSGNLGMRMERALRRLLANGGPAVLVGSDSPDLPLARVAAVLEALQRADAAAAPAADGGYVVIGLRRPLPGLFRGIPWSSPRVLAASRERARCLDLEWQEVAGWEDVDDWPALLRLLKRSPGSASAGHVRFRLKHRLPAGFRG